MTREEMMEQVDRVLDDLNSIKKALWDNSEENEITHLPEATFNKLFDAEHSAEVEFSVLLLDLQSLEGK